MIHSRPIQDDTSWNGNCENESDPTKSWSISQSDTASRRIITSTVIEKVGKGPILMNFALRDNVSSIHVWSFNGIIHSQIKAHIQIYFS